MQISVINKIEEFDQVKPNWDEVYAADAHATFFVSWPWLRGWFEARDDNWFVLAFRPEGAPSFAAFLPLALDNNRTTLAMGGNKMACYTGFVCLPEYQEKAIASFAEFIQYKTRWEEFKMGDVLDARLDNFLSHFPSRHFTVEEFAQHACPFVLLPDTWDEYMNTLGYETRKKMRRHVRNIEGLDRFRITSADANNLENQMDTFLTLWKARWGYKTEETFPWFRSISRYCYENNSLFFTILWDGETPIAGMRAYVEKERGIFTASAIAWNVQYGELHPGTAITGYCIRYAIDNRYRIFDFLEGNYPYKYSFGAEDRFKRTVIIARRDLGVIARKLLRRGRYYAGRLKSKIADY